MRKLPLKLMENRVWRLYTGGFLLDRFLGKRFCADEHFPEDWVGSAIVANNPNRTKNVHEGLSHVCSPGGEIQSLASLLKQNSEGILGAKHTEKYGMNLGVLIKLLDSAMRLPIQVHPNQELAQKYFNSSFGKTEAWIIIATRKIDETEPYILLGFNEGITREDFTEIIKNRDSEALEQSLHKISVKEGEVYLIEAGVPHAIGPGNFILEIQEPTDITLRAELKVGDIEISEEVAFQGLSFQSYMDCYDFIPFKSEDLLQKYKLKPQLIREMPGCGKENRLIGYTDTPYFEVHGLEIESSWSVHNEERFHILLIMGGKGKISCPDFSQMIKTGDYFLIPCHMEYAIENLGEGLLQAITCWGPSLDSTH